MYNHTLILLQSFPILPKFFTNPCPDGILLHPLLLRHSGRNNHCDNFKDTHRNEKGDAARAFFFTSYQVFVH